MAHEANEVLDGLYKISQDVTTKKITVFYMGEPRKELVRDRLLSFIELHDLLLSERSVDHE